MDQYLEYLKAILALLVIVATMLGITIPTNISALLDSTPAPIFIPTQEVWLTPTPIAFKMFTPHAGYVINLRTNCNRTAPILYKLSSQIEVRPDTQFKDSAGYTWIRTLSDNCIAIAYQNTSYGVIR